MRADVSLVSKDYYKEELEFQKQITRIENTSALLTKPDIMVTGESTIQITFDSFSRIEAGELNLFRPSDSAMDKKFTLHPSESTIQEFDTNRLGRGLYRARMLWTMDGKEFFHEQVIFI